MSESYLSEFNMSTPQLHVHANDIYTFITLIRAGDKNSLMEHVTAKGITSDTYDEVYVQNQLCIVRYPVGEAAYCGHVDILDALLHLGFCLGNAGFSYHYQQHPILLACSQGHLDVVKYLVEVQGVAVDYKDVAGCTPLNCARNHPKIVDYLCEQGVAVDSPVFRHGHEWVPLLWWCTIERYKGNSNVLRRLVLHGADVNSRLNGWTPLHHTAAAQNIVGTKALLKAEADINSLTTDSMETPLFLAASMGQKVMVTFLLRRGANPEIKNSCGMNALHWSIISGNMELTQRLLVIGNMCPEVKDGLDRSPINLALAEKDMGLVKLLLDVGCHINSKVINQLKCDVELCHDSDVKRGIVLSVSTPRSLLQLCTFRIRRCLGWQLYQNVHTLPVPNSLKELLKLQHLNPLPKTRSLKTPKSC